MAWSAPDEVREPVEMKSKLSIILDVGILISFSGFLYAILGGHLRWDTALFTFSLTRPHNPLLIALLQTVLKMVFNLNRGLFAMLSRRQIGVLGPVASAIHGCEASLHAFYQSHRLNLGIALAAVFGSLTLVEVYLRYLPHTLPSALANHIASGYTAGPSGIYRYEPEMKMNLMRPHFQRSMYFNGYRWNHRTDALGFRNPVDRSSADVVLLGDSMIYGHGVEETSTVRHYLEAILARPVANLAMQGSSIHQEYQVLKRFGLALKPSYVFLFFFLNDIKDLTVFLTEAEMNRFLNLPLHDHSTPYVDISSVPRRTGLVAISAYIGDLYVAKAYKFLKRQLRRHRTKSAGAADNSWEALPQFQRDPRMTLGMRFHLRALRKIQDLAGRNHFRFANIFIFTGVFEEERVYEPILKAFCEEHGITFYSLRDEFEVAIRRGEELFLKYEGHLSDAGARRVARLVASYIEK